MVNTRDGDDKRRGMANWVRRAGRACVTCSLFACLLGSEMFAAEVTLRFVSVVSKGEVVEPLAGVSILLSSRFAGASDLSAKFIEVERGVFTGTLESGQYQLVAIGPDGMLERKVGLSVGELPTETYIALSVGHVTDYVAPFVDVKIESNDVAPSRYYIMLVPVFAETFSSGRAANPAILNATVSTADLGARFESVPAGNYVIVVLDAIAETIRRGEKPRVVTSSSLALSAYPPGGGVEVVLTVGASERGVAAGRAE